VVAQAPVAIPPPAPVIAPAPVVVPAPVAIPAPAPAPLPKPWVKVTLQADSLFGFDQDSLQADGKQALDKLLQELKGVNVDAVQVTGHTDRLGSAAYNAKLSIRRAEAVRNYLVQVGGMPANLVTATGMGSAQPETSPNDCKGMKASQALITCLRVDRRVEVQVLGTQPQR
jgi:OOP family OmpA-OmpF porin